MPERGVVEVKSIREDTHAAQVREQTSRVTSVYDLENRTDVLHNSAGSVAAHTPLNQCRAQPLRSYAYLAAAHASPTNPAVR